MDINKLRDALMGLKGETPEIPFDTEANQRAAIEQSNAAVENPNTQTKGERVEVVQKQNSLETPQGQVEQARDIANTPSNPSEESKIRNNIDKTGDQSPQPSAEMMKYKALIEKMEAVQNAPKKEAGWQDYLPDALAGLHNIANYNNNQTRPNMKMDHLAKKEASRASAKKEELGGLKNLQEAYQKYMALQNKDQISPYQQATLDEKGLDRTAAQKREETKASSKAKEGKKKTKLEETREKNIGNRFDELQGQIPNRMANIEEAKALSELIKNDELDTGPGSKMAGEVGAFFDTEESTYKQRLDSLAEKAARSQLKANGEVRPTDADVEGMKKAMFNLGNTEAANVKKLKDFVKQQESGLNEYEQMKEQLATGEGLEDFRLEPTFKNEPKSTGKYGDTVERNGKQYKWNPKAGKYQPLM
jgi:hypothetical protein